MKISFLKNIMKVGWLLLIPFNTAFGADEKRDDDKILLNQKYTLSLHTQRTAYQPGEAISLIVTLRNIGNSDVTPGSSTFLGNCEFKVQLPNGDIAPLTLYGKQWFYPLKRGRKGGSYLFSLKPSEEIKASFDSLNRIYDMTLSGTYKISASIQVPKRDGAKGNVTLISNAIEIIVDENAEVDTISIEADSKEK